MTTRRDFFGLAGGAAAAAVLPPLPVPAVQAMKPVPISPLALSLILGGLSQMMEPHLDHNHR